ncbi:MAG: hypothetical protein ACRCZJ_06420 [Erysipelotrichaceae bacterium]
MKKLLALVLCAGLLAGCGSSSSTTYKVGTGSVTSMSLRDASEDTTGRVQANTTYAAVVLDKDGKIVEVQIDVAQNNGTFTTEGTIDAADPKGTKKELGDAYGMKGNSGIGKEWFEQIASLEEWMVGKTIDEVKAIAVNESGVPTSEDLTSSVTIKTNDYIAAVVKAVEASVEVSGVAKLGSASITALKAADASADADGSVQANTTIETIALDKDGKVLYANIDVAQNTAKFDAAGVITSDAAAATPTKKEKGDAYGMKGNSGISKEWFEQAASLEEWMTGKTATEVEAIAVDENGVPTSEDLTSSVTIKTNDYIATFKAAVAAALEVK